MKINGKFFISRNNSNQGSFATDISGKFMLSRSSSSTGSFNAEANPATPDFAEGQIKKFLLDLSKSYNKQIKAIKKFKEYITKYIHRNDTDCFYLHSRKSFHVVFSLSNF